METVEEEIENIDELEHNLFEEIIHSINDIDKQILSLLVQRETNYNLFKKMCVKYDKPNSNNDLINTINVRIENDYPSNKYSLKDIYQIINQWHQ